MKGIDRRLAALEQADQPKLVEEFKDTDGAEYGFRAIDGGWTVLVHNGKPIKAWPKGVWDSW
jgi:hypothetical protein